MIKKIASMVLVFLMCLTLGISGRERDRDDDVKQPPLKKTAISKPIDEYNYSDERPKSKCIFTLDLSHKKLGHDPDFKLLKSYRNVVKILEKENFYSLDTCNRDSCSSVESEKIINVFGRFISGNLQDSFIIECHYRNRSLSTFFDQSEYWLDSKSKRRIKYKWSIRKKKYESNKYHMVTCTDLSWKWVDSAIHCINKDLDSYEEYKDPNSSKLVKHLYENIRTKGLENSLMRISVVANSKRLYSFNIIFNNAKEESEGTIFLLNLKENLKDKYIVI